MSDDTKKGGKEELESSENEDEEEQKSNESSEETKEKPKEEELEKWKAIISSVNIEELSESDLCPVYPGGEPHIVIANVHIPLEIGKVLVQEAKVLHEQKKLEAMKTNLTK